MPMMNPAQTRLIDPILTNLALGYRNAELVGAQIFPAVPVALSGGQVLTFGLEAFKAYNTLRALTGTIREVTFSYTGQHYALEIHSLAGKVAFETVRDARVMPGIDYAARAINNVMRILMLELELQQAALATNAANYDSNHKSAPSGADKWSASTSNPSQQIFVAREAIRSSVGVYPNVALLSAQAFSALQSHPAILDRVKYTSRDSITTEILAQLWEIDRVVVGKAISADDAGNRSDVWGNNALLAYSAIGSMSAEEPSYGYTYTMEGNPTVDRPHYDDDTRSWKYPVHYERVPLMTGMTSGFLIASPC
ncbi:MAG: major capsid protein [Magnetococcales bacterium]|nr:major capsid protein [Magnetococcales bacterium]